MQKESQETNYIPVSGKQIIWALVSVVLTLAGIIVGIGSYFVTDFIDASETLRNDINTNNRSLLDVTTINATDIQLIKQNCEKHLGKERELHTSLKEHINRSENRCDNYGNDIARLMERVSANKVLIIDCVRKTNN